MYVDTRPLSKLSRRRSRRVNTALHWLQLLTLDVWLIQPLCMWKQCLLDDCNLFTLYSCLTECLLSWLKNNNLTKYSTPRLIPHSARNTSALSEHEYLSFSDQISFKLDCCNALQPSSVSHCRLVICHRFTTLTMDNTLSLSLID